MRSVPENVGFLPPIGRMTMSRGAVTEVGYLVGSKEPKFKGSVST